MSKSVSQLKILNLLNLFVNIYLFSNTEHLKLLSALLSFQGVCWLDVKVPPGLPGTPNCFYAMNDIRIDILQSVPDQTSSTTVPDQTAPAPTTPTNMVEIDEVLKDVENIILSEYHASEDNKDCSSLLSFFLGSTPLTTFC